MRTKVTVRNQAGTDLQARLTFPYTGSVDYLAVNADSKALPLKPGQTWVTLQG